MALLFGLLLFLTGLSASIPDMNIDDFLNYVNPPSVKKYMDQDGDSFLCVRFQDQLSIRGKEDYFKSLITAQKKIVAKRTWGINNSNQTICPQNTLTLKEITKEDIFRMGGISTFLKKSPVPSIKKVAESHTPTAREYATVEFTSAEQVIGTSAIISVWQPFVSDDAHFSLSQVWVSEPSRRETIEAGWHVYPQRYGDDRPRFFVYWTADGYHSTGCYNLECPGFVVIDDFVFRQKPLNATFYQDEAQYEIPISIFLSREGSARGWYLTVYGRIVGFWPSSLYTILGDHSSLIVYGGEISYSPTTDGQGHEFTKTDMGSGHFATEGWRASANIRQILFYGKKIENGETRSPVTGHLMATKPTCYDVAAQQDAGFGGLYMFLGGPGGDAPKCSS